MYACWKVVSDEAYSGGVLAPLNRIYLVPFNQALQPELHYIDTTDKEPSVVAYSWPGAVYGAYQVAD